MVDFSELVDWVVLDKFFVSHEAVDIVVYRVCAVHELALYSHLAEVAGFEFFRGRNLRIAWWVCLLRGSRDVGLLLAFGGYFFGLVSCSSRRA